MALGDFLQDQVNSKLQDVRENRRANKEHEQQRVEQKQDEFREHQKGIAEEFQQEVREAQQKAEEICAMSMPENYQEFVKMVMECSRNVDKPVTESALAVKMAGYEDVDEGDIDFELPAQTIKDAWNFRLEQLLKYGATAFKGNPGLDEFLKEYSKKTQASKDKKTTKTVLLALGIPLLLVIIMAIVFAE